MTSVQISRFLDAAVLSIFLMCMSGGCLFMFSQLWILLQAPHLSQWKIGIIMKSIFPFTKRFEFNLTHVLLFSIVVCLLSIRSDSITGSNKNVTQDSSSTPERTKYSAESLDVSHSRKR